MNETIITITIHDRGNKEATITVKGERNQYIMFEELFEYKDEKKRPLCLHFMKEAFLKKFPLLGKSLAIRSIRKVLNDIVLRSESIGVNDYRDIYKNGK